MILLDIYIIFKSDFVIYYFSKNFYLSKDGVCGYKGDD